MAHRMKHDLMIKNLQNFNHWSTKDQSQKRLNTIFNDHMVYSGPCQPDQFRPLFKHIDLLARIIVPNAINYATSLLSNISPLSRIECNPKRSWATLDQTSRPQSLLHSRLLSWATTGLIRQPYTKLHLLLFSITAATWAGHLRRSSRWTFFYIGAPSAISLGEEREADGDGGPAWSCGKCF